MQKLDESVVLRVFREEWEGRKQVLKEELGTLYKPKDGTGEKPAISPGLKIKHKKSGVLCTVQSVGRTGVVLKKPEGGAFLVPADALEKDYELS